MPGKIPVLELLCKMLPTDLIVGFQKLQYLRNELRHEVDFLYVSDNSSGLGVKQMGTHKLLPNNK